MFNVWILVIIILCKEDKVMGIFKFCSLFLFLMFKKLIEDLIDF